MKYIAALISSLFLLVNLAMAQSRVSISPQYPQRGETVVIRYERVATGTVNKNSVPEIRFTYSNFYEMPQTIRMFRKNGSWEASFMLPRYAVFSTFVINDDGRDIQPSPDKHYELAVFTHNKERVENGYLYQGYSLSAQERKNPDLKKHQAELYLEELKRYPDNYEAKLRLLAYKASISGTQKQTEILKDANKIIADKFHTDPGKMAYTNLTTMGYLIMGEKSRLDSLKDVIKKYYPESEAGYEFRIADLTSLKDTTEMIQGLQKLLSEETASNKSYLTDAHKTLFEYYAQKGDQASTLHHLSFLTNGFTPYTPEELKWQAEVLYQNSILPDTALAIAGRALSYADTFPVSLIRYFPETGYLPAYVTRKQREQSVKDVTGQLKSLMGLIRLEMGDKEKAAELVNTAISITNDNETLKNAALFYSLTGDDQSAFNQYRKIAYSDPDDSASYSLMKQSFYKWKGNTNGIETYEKEIEDHWLKEINQELTKEIINKPLPDVLAGYVDLSGKPVSKDLIKNKIVIMDFWATWCVPCMHAMPYLNQVYQEYKNDPDVVFMVVNSGSQNQLSDAQNWWGNKAFSFPVYYNSDRTIGNKMDFNIIPATFVIDQNRNIRFRTLGYEGKGMVRKMKAQIEMLKEIN